jgi:PPOX class probable F420-dependent enzyme
MASMDDVRRLVGLDNGLATVATTRQDGTIQATVVNAGAIDHPVSGDPAAAFIARPGSQKLVHLRVRPVATLSWRAGWAWVTLEGDTQLIGPDDALPDVVGERFQMLLRAIYSASGGGEHEDWAEFDRTMEAEGRTAVLVHPRRIYVNP